MGVIIRTPKIKWVLVSTPPPLKRGGTNKYPPIKMGTNLSNPLIEGGTNKYPPKNKGYLLVPPNREGVRTLVPP